jgi:hypothetical protein
VPTETLRVVSCQPRFASMRHDAHTGPLGNHEDLDAIFAWRYDKVGTTHRGVIVDNKRLSLASHLMSNARPTVGWVSLYTLR